MNRAEIVIIVYYLLVNMVVFLRQCETDRYLNTYIYFFSVLVLNVMILHFSSVRACTDP